MIMSVKGIWRNGQVELTEPAPPNAEGPVLVTFLEPRAIDLAERGINEQQAADLRGRLAAFAEDWSRREMDAYDAD